MRLRLVVPALLLSASLAAHADSLYGSSVDVRYLFPDTSTVLTDSGALTVTPSLEVVSSGNANLTFSAPDQITVTNPGLGPFSTSSFNGFDVAVLSGVTIDNVVLDPSSNPLFAPGVVITFTGDDIKINMEGTCSACSTSSSQSIVLDVTATATSVTPEPSSIALLATGLLGLGGMIRRRVV